MSRYTAQDLPSHVVDAMVLGISDAEARGLGMSSPLVRQAKDATARGDMTGDKIIRADAWHTMNPGPASDVMLRRLWGDMGDGSGAKWFRGAADRARAEVAEPMSSGMVALFVYAPVPSPWREEWPVEEGDALGPHVTVLYAEIPRGRASDYMRCVDHVLAMSPPVDVSWSGVESRSSTDGVGYTIAAGVNAPGLSDLRDRLLARFASCGLPTPQRHRNWWGHATILTNVDAGTAPGIEPAGDWRVVRLGVRIGEASYTIRLSGEKMGTTHYQYMAVDFGDWIEAPADAPAPPDGWTVGKPFVFVTAGKVFDRVTGSQCGLDITGADLDGVVRAFKMGDSPIAIDREHDELHPIGVVLDVWKVECRGMPALACLPAYSPEGVEYVSSGSHRWSSPHLSWISESEDESFVDAGTGERTGRMRCANIAITDTPAQAHRALTAVRLSANVTDKTGNMLPGNNTPGAGKVEPMQISPEDFDAMKAERDALALKVEELSKALEAMKAASAEAMKDADGSAAEVEKLRQEVETIREEAYSAKRAAAIDALFASGRLTEQRRELALRAYDAEHKHGVAGMFSDVFAKAEPAVNVTPSGHRGTSASMSAEQAQHDAITAYMSENKGVGYHVAALAVQAKRPELFRQGAPNV